MTGQSPFKAGYVAIVGEPNVGKSTLMNVLLNQKISIVTPKPQTTRQRVLGILSRDDAQVIFLDTPGLLKPKYLLHEKMIRAAGTALSDADVVVVIVEVGRKPVLPPAVEQAIVPLKGKKSMILAINKVDTVRKDILLPLIEGYAAMGLFTEVVPISALKADNVESLLGTIIEKLPEHPALYPPDIVSEQPERFFAAELIREKIFELFREEIPYSTAVEIVEYREREGGKTYIGADIIVERESQKAILIGKGGSALKKTGEGARKEIEQFIGCPVYLELRVKVSEKWRENEAMLKRLGYTGDG